VSGLFALAIEGKGPPNCTDKGFFFFAFRDAVMRVLFGIIYLFGLTAAPFIVVVQLDNGVPLRFGLYHNVT
jgi:hypothetical protein